MTFQSRGYLAVALVIALAVGIVWFGKERPRFSGTLALAVVAGTILGVTLSLPASTATAVPPSAEVLAQVEALTVQSSARAQAGAEGRARAETLRNEAQAAELALTALKDADGDAEAARELLREQGAPSTALEVLSQASAAFDPAKEVRAFRDAAESRAAIAERAASQESSAATTLEQQAALLSQVQSVPEDLGVLGSLQQGAAAAPEAINPDTYLERGSIQREVSAQYANSAIATDSCVGVPNPQSLRWCEVTRLPGAAFAVMFRPLWPLDIPAEWSAMAIMANVENIAWLALAAAAIWVLIARRINLTRLLTISLAYGVLVIAGMAALEGNFGTAFRHKSSTLWVFCTVLVLAGAARRSRAPKREARSVTAVCSDI